MAVTIKDIARLAGVSTATVSRVMNNSGFVQENTRNQINQVMREQNYVPQESKRKKNVNPRKNAALKSYNFAMVWSGGLPASMGGTAQEIMHGLSESASRIGATINIEFVPKTGDITHFWEKKKIDGFFLNGSFPEAFLDKIKPFPIIWLLQSGTYGFGDRVQPDHSQVAYMSCQYLLERGCKNLCCISCRSDDKFHRYWKTREQAFCNAAEINQVLCETITMDCQDNINLPVDVQKKAALKVMEQIQNLPHRPDGIFIANALGWPVYSELLANGFIPSKNVEMVAGDKEVFGPYCNPEPVRIDIGTRNLGKMAVEAMIWRIQHPEMPQLTYMLQPSLIIPTSPETASTDR